MITPTPDSFNDRLERLERENRRWRVVGVIGGLVGVAAILGAASPSPPIADKLVAREFIVVDQKGAPRARLGVAFGKAELAFDEDPQALSPSTPVEARMLLNDETLAFTGKDRTLRLKVGVYRQIDDLPALVLHDEHGRTRIDLSVFQSGPSVIVQDGNKQARAILGYIGPELLARGVADVRAPSSLVLLDKDGRIVWKTP
jgi:hypothetical protein